jgi:hypothetical protein
MEGVLEPTGINMESRNNHAAKMFIELHHDGGGRTSRVAAWPWGNVYSGGHICWGQNNWRSSRSPIDLDALFFNAPANCDLIVENHSWLGRDQLPAVMQRIYTRKELASRLDPHSTGRPVGEIISSANPSAPWALITWPRGE